MGKIAIVLAGGSGKRMKSEIPKVLHEVLFRPMLHRVIDSIEISDINKICIVKGYKHESIDTSLKSYFSKGVETVLQEEQKGTGHAVIVCKDFLKHNINDDVMIVCGDMPFLDKRTIEDSYNYHKENMADFTVVSCFVENPKGYGRIIRENKEIKKIIEEKDCTDDQKAITEINSGIYWFSVKELLSVIEKISCDNAQNEYYLTDCVELLIMNKKHGCCFISKNQEVLLGVNTKLDLLVANKKAIQDVINFHLENGVDFISIDGIIIGEDVEIGRGSFIYPSVVIKGNTKIGNFTTITSSSFIKNCYISNNCYINSSQCYDSYIGNNVKIGPFSHIRPDCKIDDNVKIGDFVEVKNSIVGESTSISHLTYVGDSDVGKNVNFGCGTVTVNYDGKNKYRTTIGDDCFIGCNTNLIAPVILGDRSYTAAGSTINKDVPSGSLGISRSIQENKKDFVNKKFGFKK